MLTFQKRCLFLISITSHLVFCFNTLMTVNQELNGFSVLNKVVVSLLTQCNFKLANIIVYDNDNNTSLFMIKALSLLHPAIVVSLKSKPEIADVKTPLENVSVNGIILIIDSSEDWQNLLNHAAYNWQSNVNCTVIIMPKSYDCKNVYDTLMFVSKLYFTMAYYVCLENQIEPVIYTHDPYGDVGPSHWELIEQQSFRFNNWTLYKRPFEKANTCQGFSFNRKALINNIHIILGVSARTNLRKITTEFEIYNNEDIEHDFPSFEKDHVEYLKKLLNIKFMAYVRKFRFGQSKIQFMYNYMITNATVDVILDPVYFEIEKTSTDVSFPIQHEDFAIFSSYKGLKTPLEKISSFYGIWTLISLLIILTIAFIAIWLKTGRNTSCAAFDILRLLINSGIAVPINTLPLRIFFSIIFIYFLIIQATFSGNLAKFLTIPVARKNVDTLEDLKNPDIKKIYSYNFTYENMVDQEVFENKTTIIQDLSDCIWHVWNEENVVCLGLLYEFQLDIVINSVEDRFYISKEKYPPALWGSITYRKRFPLREKFDWALMVLTESKLYQRKLYEVKKNIAIEQSRRQALSLITFGIISLDNLKFAFIFLSIGMSFSLLCFVIELVHHHKIGMNIIEYLSMRTQRTNVIKITILPKIK